MSTWKTAVGTFAALAGVLGVLVATGVVRIGGSDDESEDGEDGEGDEGNEDDEGSAAKTRKGKGPKRGKRKRGKGFGNLESLGYVGVEEIRPEDRGKVGVIKHEEGKAFAGLNLFNPCAWGKKYVKASGGKILRESQLVDMDGKVLHRWETTFGNDTTRGWEISRLSDDGFLYAINARTGMVKLDWDSNTVWGIEGGYHHDLAFGPDGNIWVLVEKERDIEFNGETVNIYDNGFAVVTVEGKLLRESSFYDVLKDDPQFKKELDLRLRRRELIAKRLEKQKAKAAAEEDGEEEEEEEEPATEDDQEDAVPFAERPIDIFHANTLDFASKDSKDNWKQGDIITCMRELDMIAVFDPESNDVKWQWGPGEIDRPHDPSMLDSGNLLIFDNGFHRRYSKIIEIDPLDGNHEVWSYRGSGNDPFFSYMRGLVQRMPNGNTLITSSQQGRVFEVDAAGKVVWEFWGTYVLGDKLRVPIRLVRIDGKAEEFAKKKLAESG